MTAHLWALPWLALGLGLIAFVTSIARGGVVTRQKLGMPSCIPIWILATILSVLVSLRIGDKAGVDFIPARGILLGSLSAALLVWLLGVLRNPNRRLSLIFGWGTALTAAARLWLTHGELSGLTALALGVAVTILCLAVAPSVLGKSEDTEKTERLAAIAETSILATIFSVTLASAVALGFTRAVDVPQMYWPDIPLLLAAALSIGSLGDTVKLRAAVLPILALGIAALLGRQLTHEWTSFKLVALGLLIFGVLAALNRRRSEKNTLADAPTLVGFLVLVMGGTLAFSYWAGYGMALFLIAGWFFIGIGTSTSAKYLVPALSFTSILLLHRLLLLQTGSALRSDGSGGTWDLFALGAGILLPLALEAYGASHQENKPKFAWAALLEWILLLAVPVLLIGYLLGPRPLVELVLGIALSQLLRPVISTAVSQIALLPLNGALLSLFVLQALPIIQAWDAPTRRARTFIVVGAAVLVLVRTLLPTRSEARSAQQ